MRLALGEIISSLVSPCVINRMLALQSKLSSNDNWGKWGFHCGLVLNFITQSFLRKEGDERLKITLRWSRIGAVMPSLDYETKGALDNGKLK